MEVSDRIDPPDFEIHRVENETGGPFGPPHFEIFAN